MKKLLAIGALAAVGSALGVAEYQAVASKAALDGASASEIWIAGLTEAAQSDPNDVSSRLKLARLLTEHNRLDEASQWFAEAYALNPDLADDVLLTSPVKQAPVERIDPNAAGAERTPTDPPWPNAGPDIVVGSLHESGPNRYGRSGNITAYSIATTSCNFGNVNVEWQASNNKHPVIAQALYRFLPAGPNTNDYDTFEMVGHSWLKHGFTALTGSLCASQVGYGCNGSGGSVLGVGCSDPYGSSLNGSYSWLGPKHEIEATTGFFPYPYGSFSNNSPIGKRLQVHDNDIDPGLASNTGARYFGEGHYISSHDAAFGNDNNNASYRECDVDEPSSNNFRLRWNGSSTQREKSGIEAWADISPSVTLVNVEDDDGGYWQLAYEVTDLGDGTWHYEYAAYNMNSDRSGQMFTVLLPDNVNISNVGFRDVDWHSGAPYSNTDWTPTVTPGVSISWATQTHATNPNANALRWGTLYNFRFDADTPPTDDRAIITKFKPGAGGPNVLFNVAVPSAGIDPCLYDLDGDGSVGSTDLAELIGLWGAPYGAAELAELIGSWGPCP